jgi:hypothetical protein
MREEKGRRRAFEKRERERERKKERKKGTGGTYNGGRGGKIARQTVSREGRSEARLLILSL